MEASQHSPVMGAHCVPSSDSPHITTTFDSFRNSGGVVAGHIANSNVIGQSHQYHYHGSRQASIEERKKYEALAWLSPIDYSAKQREFREKAAPDTGGWLLDSREFVDWRSREIRKLWCIGMPGAGKTILASIIVDHLCEPEFATSRKTAVACLYLTYKEQPTLEHLLGSVAKQLLDPSEELPLSLKKLWDRQRYATDKTQAPQQSPTLKDVDEILAEVTKGRQVYVIVDALDECSPGLRKPLIDHLRKISEDVNLLVTSRLLEDLNGMAQGFKRLDVVAQNHDIHAYVKHVIDRHARLLDMVNKHPTLRDEIRFAVAERSSHMFLLAQLHMDAICAQVTPFKVRKTLEELPQKREETYKSTMMRIRGQEKERQEYAIQILSWMVYAARPLSVEEILNAIAVEKGDNDFHEDKMLFRDDLEEFCCGLVVIDIHTETVRLVHYTAQNYFEDNKGQEFPGFHFNIASICATYLCLYPLEQPDGVDEFGPGISPADDLYERPEDFEESQTIWHSRERHENINGTSSCQDPSIMLKQLPGPGRTRRLPFDVKLKYYPFVVYAGQYLGYHLKEVTEQSDTDDIANSIRPLLEEQPKRNFYKRLLDHLHTYYVRSHLDQDYPKNPWLSNEYSVSALFEEPMSAASSHNAIFANDTPQNDQTGPAETDYRKDSDTPSLACNVSWLEQSESSPPSSFSEDSPSRIENFPHLETSALHLAVFLGCTSLVHELIEKRMDVDALDSHGQSAVIIAIKRSHADIIIALLQHGATIDLTTDQGHSLLLHTAQKDSRETVHEIIRRAHAGEEAMPEEELATHVSEEEHRWWSLGAQWTWLLLRIIDLLWILFSRISMSSNPPNQATDENQESFVPKPLTRRRSVLGPIHPDKLRSHIKFLSAAYEGDKATIRSLVDRDQVTLGASDDTVSGPIQGIQAMFIKTACFLAVERGNTETVKQLIDHGVSPESRDYEGRTFLHRATSRNDIPTARALLELGASPKTTDRRGLTVWAANAKPENGEILALLREYGADPNDQDIEGVNVLCGTAAKGNVRKVRFLLEQGVDPSITTIYGWTPLHWAARNGHLECVRLLLQWGAEISPISDQSTTPLDQARLGHKDVIADMLVEQGAETAEEVYAKRGGNGPSYYAEDWPTYGYYSYYSTSPDGNYPYSPDSDDDDGASLQRQHTIT